MCVILALETQKELDSLTLEILKSAESMNPDGNGYATLVNDKVVFEKGISIESIWQKIEEKEIVAPCIIHCRITSVGKTTPELCHPFKVNPKGNNSNPMNGTLLKDESVLFHNGTMSDYKDLVLQTALGSGRHLPTGLMSDTRGLAYCLESLGVEALEYIDTGFNKFAVLSSNGLQKFGTWVNVDGITSSNNYYAKTITSNNYAYGYGFDELNDYDNAFSKEDLCKTDKDAFEYHVTPEYNPYKAIESDSIIKEARNKVKSLKKEIKNVKSKISKKEHRSNIKFLKQNGWSRPQDLSRQEARAQVDLMQKNSEIIKGIKKRKSDLSDEKMNSLAKRKAQNNMTMEDYELIRYANYA